MSKGKGVAVLFFCSFFALLSTFADQAMAIAASGQGDEKESLRMYFTDEELQVVTATRSLKPISHVAENMTVVTAEDIERMNAHSLAEILNTVTGAQVLFAPRTPGNQSEVSVQGAEASYVTVMIDGVILNQLSNNMTDVGSIPAQHIERIEIVKGPASSSWGSALGGLINIVTKGPPDKGASGVVSFSYGSNHTEDYRAELRGRKGDFGIYLMAGGIHSNGFWPSSNVTSNHIYSKFTYLLAPGHDLRMSFFYLKNDRGLGDFSQWGEVDREKNEKYFGTIALTSRLTNELTLDIVGTAKRDIWAANYNYYDWGVEYDFHTDERRYGFSGKLTYKDGAHTVVAGAEFDSGLQKTPAVINGRASFSKTGIFVNDTVTIGDFSVTPGARYDKTNLGGDFISPSIGATYKAAKRTVLRFNMARGYYAPTLRDKYYVNAPSYDLEVVKVWSYQAGVETADLKYVWFKGSLFRHDVRDGISYDMSGKAINSDRIRIQGFEAEMKTITLYNFWLTAGFKFADVVDLETKSTVKLIPRYTYDIALNYDDKKSFKAMLRGRYVWWNQYAWSNGRYSSFIFDISSSKKIYTYGRHAFEIFATLSNIFNDSQYYADFYKNPRRWAEIGMRYKF